MPGKASDTHQHRGAGTAKPQRAGLLEIVCLGCATIGLALAALGDTALFGAWRAAVGAELFGARGVPADLGPFVRTTDAILGGSIVGKWLASFFLVRHGLREGRRWAWHALLAGHATWFLLDSGLSLAVGAVSNVVMINVLPGLGFLGLLMWARPAAWTAAEPLAVGSAWRALTWVAAGSAGIGLAVVGALRSPLFGFYNAALAERFGASPDIVTWQVFAYGLTGATFAAHFLMLWWALRSEPGARWVLRATLVSVLAWFSVDTLGCAAQGAWFNIALINLPSLLALGVPWSLAARAAARPGPLA